MNQALLWKSQDFAVRHVTYLYMGSYGFCEHQNKRQYHMSDKAITQTIYEVP